MPTINRTPLTILLTISIALTAAGTVVATQSGALDFLGIGPNTVPLINGTIINNDNKTYSILIVPKDAAIPEPIPPVVNQTPPAPVPVPEPPVVNQTPPVPDEPPTPPVVNDTQPPVVNDTEPIPIPVPTPTPESPPSPEPVAKDIKFIVTGDVESGSAGTSIFNYVKSSNADVVSVNGDLGYDGDLKWFKSTYGTLGNKLLCVVGNHEAGDEDGSAALEKETINLCSTSFYSKKLNNVIFFGINTNGDLKVQLDQSTKVLKDVKVMQGVKSIHLLTHKPCLSHPNAHHAVESDVKAFCDGFKAAVPQGVKVFFDAAHNHVLASTVDGQYKFSGAGGRSHYTCGENTTWTFCNNTSYGVLEYTIKPDGTTTHRFVDYNGKVLN